MYRKDKYTKREAKTEAERGRQIWKDREGGERLERAKFQQ